VIRADIALLDDIGRAVGPRSRLRLHLGTSEVGARVVPLDGALTSGESRPARVVVEEPIVTRTGDRFVLRGGSPLGTVGGGIVTDPLAPRRARALALVSDDPERSLDQFLGEAGVAGVELAELPVRLGVGRPALNALLDAPQRWRAGDRVFSSAARDTIAQQLLDALGQHHRDNPLASGAPRQWLRSRVRAPDAAIESLVDSLLRDGRIIAEQGEVRLAGFAPRLSERQGTLATELSKRIAAAGVEPPSHDELATALSSSANELLAICRMLIRDGSLVAVESNRHYSREAVSQLIDRLSSGMSAEADYGPAELRAFLGLTRKFLIPFLEYCDREGYTVRNDQGRRRRGTKLAPV
jgi:selenocysteine-specific elongation factor